MNYLIKSGDYIKVGYSSNFITRMRDYRTLNPNVEILDTFEEGTTTSEKELHLLMCDYHHCNEWFKFSNKILEIWNNYTGHNVKYESEEYKIIDNLRGEIESLNNKLDTANYRLVFVINNIVNGIEQKFLLSVDDVLNYINKEKSRGTL